MNSVCIHVGKDYDFNRIYTATKLIEEFRNLGFKEIYWSGFENSKPKDISKYDNQYVDLLVSLKPEPLSCWYGKSIGIKFYINDEYPNFIQKVYGRISQITPPLKFSFFLIPYFIKNFFIGGKLYGM